MTEDEYVLMIVNRHRLPNEIDYTTQYRVIQPLKSIIYTWAGSSLCDIKISGSRAKGTAIDLCSDLDLFISLSSATQLSLKQIYDSLYNHVCRQGIPARQQNVSIGVTYAGSKVDLVPARREGQYGNDHSLYHRKTSSWTKTNIDKHISLVKDSGRTTEITALKIWRENHNLDFPSIYLEMFAIDALRGKSLSAPASNFIYLLNCISEQLSTKVILDPANTNNVLSGELTGQEKARIVSQAKASISEKYWSSIIW